MSTIVIEVHPLNPEPRKLKKIVEALLRGALIAYPTDTTYGLGCDLLNKNAIDELYRVKGMPKQQMLALMCLDLSDIARYASVDNRAYRTLRRILPGPYTCILPATREVPKIIAQKRQQIGIRVPAAEIPRALARELGRPLLATTAGPPGGEALQWPEDIARAYPQLAYVIDAGPGGVTPTTVVDLTGEEPVIVREGAGAIDVL